MRNSAAGCWVTASFFSADEMYKFDFSTLSICARRQLSHLETPPLPEAGNRQIEMGEMKITISRKQVMAMKARM